MPMLLPVFAIAQPPTATVVFPNQWDTQGVALFGDEQDAVLMPRANAFSGTVQTAQALVGVMGDEQSVAIPYAAQWMADVITHGTTIDSQFAPYVAEEPEQEGGEFEMLLVRQYVWDASPKPSLKISGITRAGATGAVLPGSSVRLFRTDEDAVLEREISDPTTGAYTVSVFDAGYYYVASNREDVASTTVYRASTTGLRASAASQVEGVTINTLQGS